ncbi:hypothetical protein GCM10009727_90810 [Actinomadura napierensis]|uniref:Uncharacterized protein n=1 Tax=Actinomadura napierensis TaxID=267854 RepID=A0ABN3AHW1_9ACTN
MPAPQVAIARRDGSDMLMTRDPGDEAMEFIRKAPAWPPRLRAADRGRGLWRMGRLGPNVF